MDIRELNLSPRACNCLKRHGINTIEQLEKLSEDDLRCMSGIGKQIYLEIEQKLIDNMDKEKIIRELSYILTKLDGREISNNCTASRYIYKSWIELCDDGIKLFEQLKA